MNQEKIDIEFFKINLGYYLIKSPECDLQWIKNILRNSSLSPADLKSLLYEMENFGDSKRYRKIMKACADANFNCAAIEER
ncbi:MAG: hypothetical protein JSV25_13465 [Spirochaetota bacterium]|nr:MAG: hypothetical protein JSV25_13465 [Spirochaetota bacterium]